MTTFEDGKLLLHWARRVPLTATPVGAYEVISVTDVPRVETDTDDEGHCRFVFTNELGEQETRTLPLASCMDELDTYKAIMQFRAVVRSEVTPVPV